MTDADICEALYLTVLEEDLDWLENGLDTAGALLGVTVLLSAGLTFFSRRRYEL